MNSSDTKLNVITLGFCNDIDDEEDDEEEDEEIKEEDNLKKGK